MSWHPKKGIEIDGNGLPLYKWATGAKLSNCSILTSLSWTRGASRIPSITCLPAIPAIPSRTVTNHLDNHPRQHIRLNGNVILTALKAQHLHPFLHLPQRPARPKVPKKFLKGSQEFFVISSGKHPAFTAWISYHIFHVNTWEFFCAVF